MIKNKNETFFLEIQFFLCFFGLKGKIFSRNIQGESKDANFSLKIKQNFLKVHIYNIFL